MGQDFRYNRHIIEIYNFRSLYCYCKISASNVKSAFSGMLSYVLLLGSRYIEDADRQHFRDSVELKETIRTKHMAEQEKDARIEAVSNAADTERKMSAFLCHEIRNPLNGKKKTEKQKSSVPLQPLSERNVTRTPI
jgi:hypothetical protein